MAVAALIPFLCLIPFLAKPFHMDDPGYLWPAQHILQHPLDFYGFTANWYGIDLPMSQMHKNPPLVPYIIAVTALFIGWSEVALHLAFLIPAVAVSLGTFSLAQSLCNRPLLAALTAVLTPVFFVSSTSVMCDLVMVAFYVWAAALWVRGVEQERTWYLFLSAVCAALSALSKYFGISLIPLLFVYFAARTRKADSRLLLLGIPLVMLVGYELVTYRLYGTGLLTDAMSYSVAAGETRGWDLATKTMTGLSFTGGCMAAVALYAPLLWPRRFRTVAPLLALGTCAVLLAMGCVGRLSLWPPEGIRWGLVLQMALWVAAGLHLLGLAATDALERRDAGALLLFLWIFGTFAFTSFLNWTTNARTVLPMIPAAGILVARRLDRQAGTGVLGTRWREFLPLIPAACLALTVTWADFSLATCQRRAVSAISGELRGYPGTVWFQGHWGFQYYMELDGARAVDFSRPAIQEDDVVVVPSNNANLADLAPQWFHPVAKHRCVPISWLGLMQKRLGAGFYSDRWGPLPFAFGHVDPDEYTVFIAGPFANPPDALKHFRGKK
jgi:4-amino-4-deoxy-L-arabinose transferase-like glycosyltransferase